MLETIGTFVGGSLLAFSCCVALTTSYEQLKCHSTHMSQVGQMPMQHVIDWYHIAE